MPETMEQAISEAFDEAHGIPAPPAPTPAEPPADPPADPPAAEPSPTPADAAVTPPALPATPSPDAGPSMEDLKAIKARVAGEHPELEPALNAALREMEAGLTRKFQVVADLKKEALAQHLTNEQLASVPTEDLIQLARLHQLASRDPQAAADQLFAISEQLRTQVNQPLSQPAQLPPELVAEWNQLKEFNRQQQAAANEARIHAQFATLQAEVGAPIPETQKVHTLQVMQELGVTDIDRVNVIWRGLYGIEHALQRGIKQGQGLRQAKEGLGAGNGAAPPPAAAPSAPNTLEAALALACDEHGIR